MVGNYIFVYGSIGALGGRNLYILRKAKFLKKKGWRVLIVTSNLNKRKILVPELLTFAILEIKEVEYPIYYFNRWKLNTLINGIIKWIKGNMNDGLPIIVESQDVNEIFWGEIIAKELNATNIVYVIGRQYLKKMNKAYRDIYLFKAKRDECVGVTKQTLNFLFEGFLSEKQFKNIYFDISCSQEEFNYGSNEFGRKIKDLNNKPLVISTVSRLEKGYIPELIESIISVAANNKDQLFKLIIVGGSKKNKNLIKQLEKKYRGSNKNLEIIFTGFLYPLPVELYKITDIFVGMGTSVINSIAFGCPTICVDPRTLKSAGILGIDIDNFAYGCLENEVEIEKTISRLIENEQLRNKSAISARKLFLKKHENNIVLSKFLKFAINKVKKADHVYFYNSINDVVEYRKYESLSLRGNIIRYLGVNYYKLFSSIKLIMRNNFNSNKKIW